MANKDPNLTRDGKPRASGKPRGKTPMSAEEKKNKKTLKKEQQRAYLEGLRDSRQITIVDYNRLLKEMGLKPNDADREAEQAIIDSSTRGEDLQEIRTYQRKPGPKAELLIQAEREEFIAYLKTGIGRHAACEQTHIHYARFLRTYRSDIEFKALVVMVEEALPGYCMARLYDSAMNGDISSAARYIQFHRSNSDSVFQRRLASEELKLKKRATEAQIGALESQSDRPSFACLSNQELEDYEHLNTLVRSGAPLSDDETKRLGTYTVKLIQENTPKLPVTDHVAEVAQAPIAGSLASPIETHFTEDVDVNE